MTAEGGLFMVDVEVDYCFRLSAKSHKRGPDYPNRVHPFPDAGMPSDCLPYFHIRRSVSLEVQSIEALKNPLDSITL